MVLKNKKVKGDNINSEKSMMPLEKDIEHNILKNHESEISKLLQNQKYQNIMCKKIINQVEEAVQVTDVLLKSVNEINVQIGKQDSHILKTVDTSNSVASFSQEINTGVMETLKVIDETLHKAEGGQESLKNVEASMSNIKNIVEKMQLTMNDLVEKSNKIKGIVDTIKGIAKTTHLLSLNANIEAARAGDSGKGFAIVAGEVKKLAESSSKSADEIDKIIFEISKVTEVTTHIILESVNEVIKSTSVAQEASNVIDEMMKQIQTTRHTSYKIGEAVLEQTGKNRNMIQVVEEMVGAINNVKSLNENISVDAYRQKVSLSMLDETIKNLSNLTNKSCNDVNLNEKVISLDITNPKTLDYANITDSSTSRMLRPIHLGLVQPGPALDPIGALAHTWHLESDNLTWNFTLRRGLKFHNGKTITAKDVKYSFERLLSKSLDSPNRWFLAMIKGAKEFYSGKARDVAGIIISNDYNIKIMLEYPYSSFINNLMHVSCAIIPSDEGNNINGLPIGAGPFKFEYYDKENKIITLRKYNEFALGEALIDKIIYNLDKEDSTERFLNGQIDYLEVNGKNINKILNSGYKIYTTECIGSRFLLFNFFRKNPIVHSAKARQAINYIVDKQRIIKEVYGSTGSIAKSIFPTSILCNSKIRGYNRDVRKAKELMKASGIISGNIKFGVSKNIDKNTSNYIMADILRENFMEIGIKLDIVEIEPKNYYDFKSIQGIDMMLYGWIGDSGTADNFIEPLIDINNTSNLSKYNNTHLMETLNASKATINPYTYKELLLKLDEEIFEDAPYVFLTHINNSYAISKDLKGLRIHPLNLIKMDNIWREEF